MSFKNIAHLTSVHPRFDTRIFIKMCSSLSELTYETCLVVADNLGDEIINDVSIFDVGVSGGGRLSRALTTVNKIYERAIELDADLYHLHDPELIRIGLKLKKKGKKVIFDAHEDFPNQLKSKPYLNSISKAVLPKLASFYERIILNRFDAIVAATPVIRDKYSRFNDSVININNYPKLNEIEFNNNWQSKSNEVVYAGAIGESRGLKQMVRALEFTNGVRLNLAGLFNDSKLKTDIQQYKGWGQVNELGHVNRQQLNDIFKNSKVGLVTLLPTPSYVDSLPVKLFEYMAAGIPVIASNFPIWQEIVEENQCGICVDPLDVSAIGKAIQFLIDNPLESKRMGANARVAVEDQYSWSNEEVKLANLYHSLLY